MPSRSSTETTAAAARADGAVERAGKVLVTGATGGIGGAICRRFARDGWHVVVGYRSRAAEAEALARELEGSSVALSVDDSRSLAAAAAELGSRLDRLDVLVNNAGTTRFVPHDDLHRLDDALFDEIMRVNVRGAFASIRAFHGLLLLAEQPVVVNISSQAARTGIGSNVAYCASKAALETMTRSLARALAPQVRVVSVAPGLVDTKFVRGLDPEWRAQQEARTPLGRLASPDEIADAVWAGTTSLRFSTGCCIAVDGGFGL
jgi:3-oxoacyl-[acyl-carrier protein] reductase